MKTAFNNVSTDAIHTGLENIGTSDMINHPIFIGVILNAGAVIPPLLWNLVINQILIEMKI